MKSPKGCANILTVVISLAAIIFFTSPKYSNFEMSIGLFFFFVKKKLNFAFCSCRE